MWIIYACALEAVVIVTGNVVVLVIFTRTPSLRTRKHYLLVSLAVADLFVGLISVPGYLVQFLTPFSASFQLVFRFEDILFGTASVFGLTAVAVERAYAVYFPIKHRLVEKGTYIIGIAVIWLLALLFAILLIFNILVVYGAVTTISLSLAIVIISYILIWIKISCMTNVANHATHRRDMKMTVTLMIVTAISLVAWIPFQVMNTYATYCEQRCLLDKQTELMLTKILHYGNSLVNPVIYTMRMPEFRRSLFKRLPCNCRLSAEVENRRAPQTLPNVIPLTAVNKNQDGNDEEETRSVSRLSDMV